MPLESRLFAQSRKKRVSAACDFCRRRKLGCDNIEPRCGNCQSYEKQCTYTTRVKRARPSNSRIRQLEEENIRLRRLSQGSAARSAERELDHQSVDQVPVGGHVALCPRRDGLVDDTINTLSEPHSTASVGDYRRHPIYQAPRHHGPQPDQESQFHGPSSAMFDEPGATNAAVSGSDVANSDYRKCQLLAETTRQRQMEMININAGKLDFDGVEPEVGLKLLTTFWNRQHHSGPIVYRSTFMRDMACNGPSFSKLLLNAIYFSASDYVFQAAASDWDGNINTRCDATDSCTVGHQFRRKFEKYLHDPDTRLLFKSQVTTIQALLLVSNTMFSWCDEKSLSWHYSGIAVNMIIDLGLHTESHRPRVGASLLVGELETHRRLFWAAFATDKLQSVYQGRPARLREHDNSVPLKFLDEFEELEPFSTNGYAAVPTSLGCPGYGVSTFEQLCKLSVIMDRILLNIYAETSSYKDPGELIRMSNLLDDDLKAWRKALPTHFAAILVGTGNGPALPHTISLLALYNATITLLHRPFVSDGHLRVANQSRAGESFAVCAAAASSTDALLQQYTDKLCAKSAPYALSYAVYVSATIHLRIAAQRQPGSEAHNSLRKCLDFLHEHQILCRASGRSLNILNNLVRRLKVDPYAMTDTNNSAGPEIRLGDGSHVGREIAIAPPAPTDPQADMLADETYFSGPQSGVDTHWSDLDIDQILESFNYDSQPGSNLGALGGNATLIDGGLDGTSQSLDILPTFDSLFGLEM
ncbi:fungal-specific transcription factor domain-containing protein [Aspergillus karnatakaensis]|uniref:transcription factor domain-containing protein n=1 Tax=Aspergillus karnatakaensis TaxID=1810916 RepID=UPI003CCCC935